MNNFLTNLQEVSLVILIGCIASLVIILYLVTFCRPSRKTSYRRQLEAMQYRIFLKLSQGAKAMVFSIKNVCFKDKSRKIFCILMPFLNLKDQTLQNHREHQCQVSLWSLKETKIQYTRINHEKTPR